MRFVVNDRFIVYAENRLQAVQLLRQNGYREALRKIEAERLEDAKTALFENRRTPGA